MDFFRYRRWIILVGLSAGIKFFSFFPGAVEKYYSTGFYPLIARLLRILFGWIPFSIGDIFYAAVIVWLVMAAISFLRKLFKKQIDRYFIVRAVSAAMQTVLVIYILFNVLWGLNYNRRGIAYQLQLNIQTYSTTELQNLLRVIVGRLNELDSASRIDRSEFKRKKRLFDESIQSYHLLSGTNAIFSYPTPSVKPSLFSYAGNYLGFTGYYNPFSGEAQVNTTVPVYVQPFTTCHEIGHQLGYAKEDEANIAGYLSARSSDNPLFRYSVYFDLYLYAATELYLRDSTLLVPLREKLKPDVRADFRDLRNFYKKYENPMEPYIRRLYGRYLKANSQPKGIMSYDEIIAWMIAYAKKYGEAAL
ncbi:MAG TPA: DUF3810 domain-containing protein [Puia sp.]|nr:DUF3810 domain-containing protein [Puia sp.]